MRSRLCPAGLSARTILSVLFFVRVAPLRGSESLGIERAVRIDFPTEVGKFYQLQKSISLEEEDWVPVGEPVKGDGETVEQLFPMVEDADFILAEPDCARFRFKSQLTSAGGNSAGE